MAEQGRTQQALHDLMWAHVHPKPADLVTLTTELQQIRRDKERVLDAGVDYNELRRLREREREVVGSIDALRRSSQSKP
jgi:hypothetical protein